MQAALIVLDGWGMGAPDTRDAVRGADTPTVDGLSTAGGHGQLTTSGRTVGLPDGQAGNSEVGHLTIGAGRAIPQAFTRINDAIEDGRLAENEAIDAGLSHAAHTDGRVHFMGLVSDGGVHSHQDHLHALLELAARRGVPAVTHAFTDGRDTDPQAGEGYLQRLEEHVSSVGTGTVATVAGRYYAMDRDQNWDRTERAYDAIVEGDAPHVAASGPAAVRAAYERGETDEFIEPTVVEGAPRVEDGDAVVWFNFRADRARQLVRMLASIDPDWPFELGPPDVRLVTMTEYDETFDLPVAFPPVPSQETLGEVVAEAGCTQLRIAETEKYAHVTYFLNGGREVEFPGERREIAPSPDVPTYDLQPEMSAEDVTDTAIERIQADDPDVLVLNYANPDMVGHTGDYEAAVAAVEAVDAQLDRLVTAVRDAGGDVLILADHGNADDMGTPEEPHTAHTNNPVPVIYRSADGSGAGGRIRQGGSLPDVAPTILDMMGLDPPAIMTGRTLLQ